MQLILAIDSDPRRSEQLAALVRARFSVDLVLATSAGEGLHALKDRVPDLILTAPLLSPFDDGVLDEYLRDLGTAATHIQTVRIPMLSAPAKKKSPATRLFGLGRKQKPTSSAAPDGCDPKVFADEIAHYLTRSLEERSASTKSAPAQGSPLADHPAHVRSPEPEPQQVDDWYAPESLVTEFTEPMYEPPAPIPAARVVEETHVPGSILDLRPPVVRAPAPPAVVEPEPQVCIEPEPYAFVEPERQTFVEPELPAYVEPVMETFEPDASTFVVPEPQALVEPEPRFVVEAEAPPIEAAVSAPSTQSAPAASAAPSGTSSSFEAALAAIRAAWVKPEDKKPEPSVAPVHGPASGSPKPLAGSGEVDLTTEIDALEDVVGSDTTTVADDEPSSDESKAPGDRRTVDKSRKRPEKPHGRKMRGFDGRDEWGVFDPKQCGFSALVNKLDEVTEDEVTGPATTTVR